MIFIHMRKTLVFITKNSYIFPKSRVSFSLYFSTSNEKHEPVTNRTVSEFLAHKHQFSPQLASRVASALTHVKNPKNLDSVLSFLKEKGFSKSQLERTIQYRPELLVSSLDKTIRPKFKIFQHFGFSDSEIAVILSKDPWILKCSLSNRVAPALSVLNNLLGNNAEVAKLLTVSSWFLAKDLEKTLVPNIEVLVSCGIGMDQICKLMYSFPRFFLNNPETMKKLVDRAEKIGADRNSRMFLQAVRVLSAMNEETWEMKLRALREFGFSEDDILMIFRKAPQVFAVSLEKMKKITEVLLATGKYDMSCIINSPKALTSSVDKRYKPRLRVLGALENKNLIKEWPSLNGMYLLSDEKFFEKFVAPYVNEIGDIYMAKGVSR